MRFCTFNVENLFLNQSSFDIPRKSEEKTKWLSDVIKDIDPDIALLIEVGGLESLNEFNRDYLDHRYKTSLIRGNSSRGIDIGYLIKPGLAPYCEHLTHRNRPLNFLYHEEKKENEDLLKKGKKPRHLSHLMSRDIAELRVYKDLEKKHLRSIFLGVHLKSKLDDKGFDWLGKKRRGAELKLTLKTYDHLNERYFGKVPIFITGDLNGDIRVDDEFLPLKSYSSLIDITDALKFEDSERGTFVLFDKNKRPNLIQLDYFLGDKKWFKDIKKQDCGVYRYQKGNVLPIPQSPHVRHSLPSDHYPLVVSLPF